MINKTDLIFGYGRVSTFKQVEGISLSDQKNKIEIWVQRATEDGELNHPVYRHYEDRAKSGKKMKGVDDRPQFSKLMEDVSTEKPKLVIVAKLDRWGRSTLDILNNVAKLEELEVGFVIVDLKIDTTTPAGKLVLSVMSSLAQFERDQIYERTQIGIQEARKRGVKFGRRKIELNEKSVIADVNQMGITNTAVKRKISRGTITSRLAEWGYKKGWSKNGKEWVKEEELPKT